jgi:hypothetical protein
VVSATAGPPGPEARSLRDRAARSLRRAAAIYTAGGLVYALVLTMPWMLTTEGGFPLTRLLWISACYAWPIVLTLGLLAAAGRGDWLKIAAGYFAFVAAAGSFALARNPTVTTGQLVLFWTLTNGAETLLLLAFLNRRVRAVGPLVLAFTVAGVSGSFLFIDLAGRSEAFLRAAVSVALEAGLGARTVFALMHVVGFAVFALLAFPLLRWIGRRYEAKRMSDQSLTIDALWLVFGLLQSITLLFEGGAWVFTGVAAFAAFKLVTRAGFALWREGREAPPARAPLLLLLRVFALGRKSERLFDVLARRWLRAGGIGLIAGPDLATTAIEPHEFLAFVGGRLARQFVHDDADLERRVARLDTRPDPDGRFRVTEFFCHADTWQMTMRRLARASDAVLMDLRSFSPANQGCLYELEELLGAVPLDRVLFVVDRSTDRPFLERSLGELWPRVPAGSPNRDLARPAAHLFDASGRSGRPGRLLELLFAQSAPR